MASAADSRLKQLLIPSLDKIIKNGSWRKNSKLVHECKNLIEKFNSPDFATSSPPQSDSDAAETAEVVAGPVVDSGTHEYSLEDSELILSPLINAVSSGNAKIADVGLSCLQKLISHGYLRGEVDLTGLSPESKVLSRVIDSVCKCVDLIRNDENIELVVLRTLLSAVTSTSLRIHGDCLLQIVRTCYDIYLGSRNVVNQTTAKASLIQMLVIVFRRMEADSSSVPVQPIVVAELMEPAEKEDTDPGVTMQVQGFITRIIEDIDGVLNNVNVGSGDKAGGGSGVVAHDGAFETKVNATVEGTNPADLLDSTDKDMLDAKYWEISMYKTALEGRKGELADGEAGEGVGVMERDDDLEVQIGNKLRRDAFLVFRALCKLSMKTPPKEALSDPQLMRGKIVALELLKILLENAGTIFRTSDRYTSYFASIVDFKFWFIYQVKISVLLSILCITCCLLL